MEHLENIGQLASIIVEANNFFLQKAHKQVNTAMTLRNWLFGFYLVEYEQSGKDRADYGAKLYKVIAQHLANKGLRSVRERHLYLCKDFYKAYPQILRTASAKFHLQHSPYSKILPRRSDSLAETTAPKPGFEILLTTLSFSHFIELLKPDTDVQRRFYEKQAVENNWSVRALKRAIGSLLYERTGFSKNKEAVLKEFEANNKSGAEELFRNTYLLEFLGLEEKDVYTESDLEERIITHLQNFLLELGRGFCFEHRQKRITFGNTHYRIDLVFYHRILKCHVLLDLKIGEFDHSDAGQMNMYLNYFKDTQSSAGDNDPVGIILCSGKKRSFGEVCHNGATATGICVKIPDWPSYRKGTAKDCRGRKRQIFRGLIRQKQDFLTDVQCTPRMSTAYDHHL